MAPRALTFMLLDCLAASELPRTFLWQGERLLALKQQATEHGPLEDAVKNLKRRADGWLEMGPWTVTSKEADIVPEGADIHDYASLNKYWWPCTATPSDKSASVGSDPTCEAGVLHVGDTTFDTGDIPVCCPLSCASCGVSDCASEADDCCLRNIVSANRSCNSYEAPCVVDTNACNEETGLPYHLWDGLVNPESEKYDHDALENMTGAVMDLSLAAFYTENETYASHAAEVLQMWFLNESTRMNPNLQWGHLTPGWCDQRRQGVCPGGTNGAFIDMHWNPELLDAAALLHFSHPQIWQSSDQDELLIWFGQYLDWANSSVLGGQEHAEINNHGVWFDVQNLAIALHVGNNTVARDMAHAAGPHRIDVQVTSTGSLPSEDARTKAFSYNNFALMALTHLATLVEACRSSGGLCEGAPSLFDYEAENGASLRRVVEHQLSWVLDPVSFPLKQVVSFLYPECTESMVDQCLATYFWPLRRASLAYENASFERAISTIDGLDYEGHVVNLVLPKLTGTSMVLL